MSLVASISSESVVVEPGATAPLTLEVENRGEATESFEIGIEGIDGEWIAIPVPSAELKPGERQSLKVFFKPPRQSESTAGNFPFVAKVRSLATGDQRIAQGILTVKPFHSLTLELTPKKGFVTATKTQNIFAATVMNMGNSEHTVQLMADDPENSCTYEFDDEQITVGPGQQRDVDFAVHPKKGSPLGSPRLIGFAVTGRSTTTPGVVASSQAQLEVRPFITPATIIVFFIMSMLALTVWLTQPKKPEVILDLMTGPTKVTQGTKVVVHWQATNASAVKLVAGGKPIGENLPPEGTQEVETPLLGSLTIQAVAFRDNRQSEPASVTIIVEAAPFVPEPKILELKPSQDTINKGEKFTLSYKFDTGVVKAKLGPDNIDLDLRLNTILIEPAKLGENEYTVVAENSAGKSVKKTFKVQMIEPVLVKIVKFEISPEEVEEGGKVTMNWQIEKASKIEFSYTGSQPYSLDSSGTTEIPVVGKTTFILKATDANGKVVTKSITVRVKKAAEPPPTDPDNGDLRGNTTGATTAGGGTNGR
ncbi:MAG: hypothetical protein WCK51_04050 [Armatimonadota bacterium]